MWLYPLISLRLCEPKNVFNKIKKIFAHFAFKTIKK